MSQKGGRAGRAGRGNEDRTYASRRSLRGAADAEAIDDTLDRLRDARRRAEIAGVPAPLWEEDDTDETDCSCEV